MTGFFFPCPPLFSPPKHILFSTLLDFVKVFSLEKAADTVCIFITESVTHTNDGYVVTKKYQFIVTYILRLISSSSGLWCCYNVLAIVTSILRQVSLVVAHSVGGT